MQPSRQAADVVEEKTSVLSSGGTSMSTITPSPSQASGSPMSSPICSPEHSFNGGDHPAGKSRRKEYYHDNNKTKISGEKIEEVQISEPRSEVPQNQTDKSSEAGTSTDLLSNEGDCEPHFETRFNMLTFSQITPP